MIHLKPKNDVEMESIRQDRLESLEAELRWDLESRTLVINILTLLNQHAIDTKVVKKIIDMVKKFTGFDAAAVRMRKGEDFPYVFANGLDDDFIEAENSICARDKSGEMVRDSEGNPILECICGQVIRGNVDSSLPFFTDWGSFWTNGRSRLLASRHGDGIERMVRRRFNSCGWESIAIIPLRSSHEIVGLLQFNDRRENCFSPEIMLFFEAIGSIIGIVFARLEAEQGLLRAKEELEHRVKMRTAALLSAKKDLELEIEERKTVEQELLMAQHRLELAMAASNLTTWDWDLEADQVYFDQRWCSIMGYSFHKIESNFECWQNRIHPQDKLRVLQSLKASLSYPSQSFLEVEYRLGGEAAEEYRWILDRGKVVERDDKGKPLRMVGISLDITDRRRMEEELHESAERFRGIFESARECIFVKNALLQYTHVNPAFASMMGLRETEVVGRTDSELYDSDAATILCEVDRRVLGGESVEQEHTRVVGKLRRTFLDTKVPMRNNRGEILGIMGISMEITDRKRTQCLRSVSESDCKSAAMRSTLHTARLAAETDTIILLMGESGSGKDYIARYIHDHSKRTNGPFFSINCAAVSPELAESELFGYESGAFTGSKGPKRGLLELAEGGTILLNEIGELSLQLQAKLLTFLDTRQFTRVGGVKVFTVNARLIAATNRDLEKEVELGRFRQDLFYRLDVFAIEIPPLRNRMEDIPYLVGNIVAELAPKVDLESVPELDALVLEALASYSWPGNVRELRNVLERALILCDKRRVRVGDLAINKRSRAGEQGQNWSVTIDFPENETINDVTMHVKRLLVVEALRRAGGRRVRAAVLLGISPDSLRHYMQIFGLYDVLPFSSRSSA